ncbi:hypothetical protein CRT23_12870 [Methylobacterium sp. V23]|nr:hypothetical protein CRT23_12870 [Methylobacterium sp. V23]
MFSEKAFQDWKSRQGAVEERERTRVRSEIAAEIDGALDEIRTKTEVERSREKFLHATRHARAVAAVRDADPKNPVGTECRTTDGTVWVRKA